MTQKSIIAWMPYLMKMDNTIVFSEAAYKRLSALRVFEDFMINGASNLTPKGIMGSGDFNG
jgi:hypothetical protein